MSVAMAPDPTPSPIPVSDRFTVVPKIREVCPAGLPAALIPTYAALADYANNTTGLCWPEMETLAWLLKRSVRTVQRHVHKLQELGLVEIVERRRRPDGTFLGYLFCLPHIVRAAERIRERKKANEEAYEERKREQQQARERKRKRRLSHRREQDASRSSTASSPHEAPPRRRTSAELKGGHEPLFDETPISGEEGARRRREGYEYLFDNAPSSPSPTAAEGPPDAPPPPLEPEVFPAPSTGHSRPLAPICATSRSNHFPPNPPEGDTTEHREEAMHRTPEPSPRHQLPAPPDHLTAAERAWFRLRGALLDAHPDLDAQELSTVSVALDGATLRVVLRSHPIISYENIFDIKQVGDTADRVRSRHGGELSRLWRELSGDPHALLDLSPAS